MTVFALLAPVPLLRQSEEFMTKNHDLAEQCKEYTKEYTPENFPGGLERDKYSVRIVEGANIVRLDPDIARAFPDSLSVNEALRSLLRIVERTSALTKRSSARS